MKLKYYLRGMGIGIILTAIVMGFALGGRKATLSNAQIIERAKALGIPVISAMGAGNKLDPSAFRVADIYKTKVCPLCKVMRKELKKRNVDHLKVVYSEEEPIKNDSMKNVEEGSSRRSTPGSTAFTPAACGLVIASEVVKDLIKK